jgi:hypothetical protein
MLLGEEFVIDLPLPPWIPTAVQSSGGNNNVLANGRRCWTPGYRPRTKRGRQELDPYADGDWQQHEPDDHVRLTLGLGLDAPAVPATAEDMGAEWVPFRFVNPIVALWWAHGRGRG